MISVKKSKELYELATAPDYALIDTHLSRISRTIELAAENGEEYAIHEVDWFILGPWAAYDVDLVTQELMRRLKKPNEDGSCYSVKLLGRHPHRLKIWGWIERPREKSDTLTSARTPPLHHLPPQKDTVIRAARHGELSRRLQSAVRKHHRK
jgi:hypothetical protein